MQPNVGQLIADMWEQTLRETPDPWLNLGAIMGSGITYRDRLTRPLYNYRGELIPRIVIVRNNIRRLGRIPPVNLP